MADLRAGVDAIPNGDGWWHSDGCDTFTSIAERMVAKGFTPAEALELLSEAYHAAAAEYGD